MMIKKRFVKKAGVIAVVLPVMWKLVIGDINLVVAIIITISGGGCLINPFILYFIMSICRICLYHEFSWFMEMDQRKMSRMITATVFIFWLAVGIFLFYSKYISEEHDGYTILLISNISCKQVKLEKITPPTFIVIVLLSLTFSLECYIALKVKKLPWFKLKSVTIGHLIMGATLYSKNLQFSSMIMYGIKPPLTVLIFQFLYFLKYRDQAIEFAKQFCLTRTNRINPDEESDDLNDFGIFVGPQNTNNTERTEMRVFSISYPI